jgi:hypothetical protein
MCVRNAHVTIESLCLKLSPLLSAVIIVAAASIAAAQKSHTTSTHEPPPQTPVTQPEAPAALTQEYGGESTDSQSNTSSARRLFKDAVEEADRGRWEQAAELFRHSNYLRASPATTYNLASAYGRIGRIVEAVDLLHSVIWDNSAAQNVRDIASSLRDSLMPQIAWLTIRVDGEPSAYSLTLDSRPLPTERLGIAIAMDPGRHVIGIQRRCSYLDTRLLVLAPGTAKQETISFDSASFVEQQTYPYRNQFDLKNTQSPPPKPKTNVLANPWFWVGPAILVTGAITAALLWTSSAR